MELQNATIGGILMAATVISLAFVAYKVAKVRIFSWLSSPVVVQKDDDVEEEEEVLDHSEVLLERAEHLALITTRTAAVLVTVTLLAIGILLVRTGGLADGLAQAVAKIGGAG